MTAKESGQTGLDTLIGSDAGWQSTQIQQFITDTAVAAVADGFDLDGVVLVEALSGVTTSKNRAVPGSSSLLAARLPPSWSVSSDAVFEIYGELFETLKQASQSGTSSTGDARHLAIGTHSVWLAPLPGHDRPLAVAVFRTLPLSQVEGDALLVVLSSLVAALSETTEAAKKRSQLRSRLVVAIDGGSEQYEATVGLAESSTTASPAASIKLSDLESSASGTGHDVTTAVARAAAVLCGPGCEAVFAGCSELENVTVTIVLVSDHRQALRLGVAVRPTGDLDGAAEAVLTALG